MKTRGLTDIETKGLPEKEFNKTITVDVTKETYDLWLEWKKRVEKMLGYENDSKVLEFALVEATNTPKKSLE